MENIKMPKKPRKAVLLSELSKERRETVLSARLLKTERNTSIVWFLKIFNKSLAIFRITVANDTYRSAGSSALMVPVLTMWRVKMKTDRELKLFIISEALACCRRFFILYLSISNPVDLAPIKKWFKWSIMLDTGYRKKMNFFE